MIVLHNVSLGWSDGYKIDIEWLKGQGGTPIALPIPIFSEANIEAKPDNLNIPALCYRDSDDSLFEPLQLREQTEYIVTLTLPLNIEDARKAMRASPNQAWPFRNPRLENAFSRNPDRHWIARNGTTTIEGRLNFGSHVGIADLSILNDAHEAKLEVVCYKIGYIDDFKLLLNDLARYAVELLLKVDTATGLEFDIADVKPPSPEITLFHLRRLMSADFLPESMEAVLKNPHNRVLREERLVPTALVRDIDPEVVMQRASTLPMKKGGPLKRLFKGMTPELLPEVGLQDTFDTPENRFVKFIAEEIQMFCQQLLEYFEPLRTDTMKRRTQYEASCKEIKVWMDTVDEWLSEPFWREVGKMNYFPANSQVLQKRDGYKDFLEAALVLQLGLRLPWEPGLALEDGEMGDIRPIYALYEFWCFFSLLAILRGICGDELPSRSGSSFLKGSGEGLKVNLEKGKSSKVKFQYTNASVKLNIFLFYNREFRRNSSSLARWTGSYSATFHPDFSILAERMDGRKVSARHWLHFDAKYRLDFSEWRDMISDYLGAAEADLLERSDSLAGSEGTDGLELSDGSEIDESAKTEDAIRNEENSGQFKRGDLYKMHTYRDAILGSRGAYILFPGKENEPTAFVRHPSSTYRSTFVIPGVGAFPLKPTTDAAQLAQIKTFLERVFESISGAKEYIEEEGLT